METKIFNELKEFYHFVNWYNGELFIRRPFSAYDINGNLVAILIKNKNK